MSEALSLFTFVAQNYGAVIAGVATVLSGVIAICLIIPGDQPEKALQGVLDFLAKFSAKPK